MPGIKWRRIRGAFQGQQACGECGAVCWGPRDKAQHITWHLELADLLEELLGRELPAIAVQLTEGMEDPGPEAILDRARGGRPGFWRAAWAEVREVMRLRPPPAPEPAPQPSGRDWSAIDKLVPRVTGKGK